MAEVTFAEPFVSPLTLRLFGAFQARRADVPLSGLHLREGERILAYLVLSEGQTVSSLELAKRFYPSEAENGDYGQGSFPCVRQAMTSLRRALGDDAMRLKTTVRAGVELDLSGVDCDVTEFDRLARRDGKDAVQAWARAVELSAAPLLETWNEAWIAPHRTRRKRDHDRLLRRLIAHELDADDSHAAETWIVRLLHSCPDDETAARDLLRLLTAQHRFTEMREAQERLEQAVTAAGRTLEPETTRLIQEGRCRQEQDKTQRPSLPLSALPAFSNPSESALIMEAAGGAMPANSPFYVVREADEEFQAAVERHDSIVLVKGARQVGKTSLLARALQSARAAGARVVLTDFQKFNEAQLATPDTLCLALATSLALQLDLDVSPESVWKPNYGANLNLEQFLRRHILKQITEPLVWGLDELDRLFGYAYSSEIFSLFRSWHNERSLDPSCPWNRLTLAMAYATEAHLFIADLNQSPFNVGTSLAVEDFTLAQIRDCNRRHGEPLSNTDLTRFHDLVGGQPYLVRHGLNALAAHPRAWTQFAVEAASESGIYGDHLRRLFGTLARSPELTEAVRALLFSQTLPTQEQFFRLRTAGILSGASFRQARFRCRLYSEHLAQRLTPNDRD